MNNNKIAIFIVTIMVLTLPHAAFAGAFLNLGLSNGGDTLEEGYYSSLKAGDGFSAELGYDIPAASQLVYRVMYGTRTMDVAPRRMYNGSYHDPSINTKFIHALVMSQQGRIVVGGGLAYYIKPVFTDYTDTTNEFGNSLGLVGELNLSAGIHSSFYFGIRYTSIKYKGATATPYVNSEVGASHSTLLIGWRF